MCSICTSHTSKSKMAAERLPEFIMCCECGRVYSPNHVKGLIRHQRGLCDCGHQMIPIKEVIGNAPIHTKLIEALSKSLEVVA